MRFFSRKTPTSPASSENGVRRSAPDDYFTSREIYRSERGFILVDAFRFVSHYGTDSSTPASSSSNVKREGVHVKTERDPWQCGPHKFFFLSHFHSDHYTGIQQSWHTDTIYCSRATAALTQASLGVSSACLFPMDFNETYIFSLQTGTCLACVPETPLHPRVQAMLHGAPPPSPPAVAHASHKASTARTGVVDQEDTFAVRLIPANHCPGAAILLFTSPLFGTVVHTGDFRFNGTQRRWREGISAAGRRTYVAAPQLRRQARRAATSAQITEVPVLPAYEQFIEDDEALREVASRQALDVLFLDNTFCGPLYKFPTQWEVTQTVVEVLRSLLYRAAGRKREAAVNAQGASGTRPVVRCAVLIGCYTIGKERVALAIRDAFCREPPTASHGCDPGDQDFQSGDEQAGWPIYVSPQRYAMLKAMNFFTECFQPLPESKTQENADASTRNAAAAQVVGTPVQLPVLLHSATAQHIWEEAQAQGGCGVDSDPSLTDDASLSQASPNVRRNLSADFGTPLSDTAETSSSGEARYELSVFLVPMASVNYQSVANLVKDGDRASLSIDGNFTLRVAAYDAVLLVEPTGWCKRCATRDLNDRLTLLKVPYSEHCGFHEMINFVQFMNPARVVPTVSEENFKKHEALFVEKAPRLRSRVSNVQPITRFFSTGAAAGAEGRPPPPPSANSLHTNPLAGVKAEEAKGQMERAEESSDASTQGRNHHGHACVTNVRTNPRERRAEVSLNAATATATMKTTTTTTTTSESTVSAAGALHKFVASTKAVGQAIATAASAALSSARSTESTSGAPFKNCTEASSERKRPASEAESLPGEPTKTASAAQTLDRLFRRVKVDHAPGERPSEVLPSITSTSADGGDEDEDCQVVRVVQTVVEISDDD